MPAWLQNSGAWIAIGISLLFLVAAVVMHHVFVQVLRGDQAPDRASSHSNHDTACGPTPHD